MAYMAEKLPRMTQADPPKAAMTMSAEKYDCVKAK